MSPKIIIKLIIAAVFFALIAILFVHYHELKPIKTSKDQISIILSPHFDDAVLSLGGYMSEQSGHEIVANFFVDGPIPPVKTNWDTISGFSNSTQATQARIKENDKALSYFNVINKNYGYEDFQYRNSSNTDEIRSEIELDIQALISSRTEKTINVFGPATFGTDVTHPDHQILHEAFLDVAKNYPRQNVQFYMYEDFPYTKHFLQGATTTLENFLDNDLGSVLIKTSLYLTTTDLATKIKSLGEYSSQIQAFNSTKEDIISEVRSFTGTRCQDSDHPICEIAYKLIHI